MMKTLLIAFVAGLLFGAGLALSGMTNPEKVIGFLDITGEWDATLIFVMGGALVVFGSGYWLLRKRFSLPSDSGDPITGRLILGAVCFGVGWGLSGFCPGPALASLGALRLEALIFVPAMALGMFIAQRGFGADS